MADFKNCIEITEALGYDPRRYSPYQTAARYVRDAGFAFTDTTGGVWSPFRPSLAKRCGVRLHELVLIVSYHHHYVEKRRWAEWESRRDAAQQLVDFYAQKDPATRESWLFDPAYAFDNVGPEPVYDQAILDAAEVRSATRDNVASAADADEIDRAIASYTGPIKRFGKGKGYPNLRAFQKHLGRPIRKDVLWARWEAR